MNDLDRVRWYILKTAKTPSQAMALAEELSQTDWHRFSEEMQLELTGKTCRRCKQKKDRLMTDARITCNRLFGYCVSCLSELIQIHTLSCRMCNNPFVSARRPPTHGFASNSISTLCAPCRTKDVVNEEGRIRKHINLALASGRAATLTLQQWVTTLTHFKGLCAYCGVRPYEVVEHFIPSTDGGGTTQSNCVPACSSCNTLKWGYNPYNHTWDDTSFNSSVKRVQSYLNQF